MTRLRWLSALLLTAIGLYFSRALLDIVAGSSGVVRVAMLPPWGELAGFAVILGALGLVFSRGDRDADVAVPLCVLGLLAMPYLPWLPDRLPILRSRGSSSSVIMPWLV